MTSLASIRPALTQALCKRQLCAYLSPATRLAHTAASVPTTSSARRYRRKTATKADTAEPSKTPTKSAYYGKLKPYDLSNRLRALTETGELDAAVNMLKAMPLDAQNVGVWNTVIKAAFDAGKLKLAYSLYADLKRRGFRPNLRTYTTMLSGYHRIRSWEGLTTQHQNLHSVYRSLKDYLESVPDSLDSGTTSFAVRAAIKQYLDACYNAHQSTELQEAFDQLPLHGPLARDARMYAPYLCDLLRKGLPPAELATRVREIWKDIQDILAKNSAGDARTYGFLADLVFQGLTQSPTVADHNLAFDIVRDVFALHPKGKAPPSAMKGIAMPRSTAVHVLKTANLLGRPDFVLDVAKLVTQRADLQGALSMPVVHSVLSATRETSRRDSAKVLSDLVQVIAAQRPYELDKAPLTVQGVLKTCLECEDFAASKSVLGAVLRLRPSELATAGHVHHAKTVTTTSWTYFARSALYGDASDARPAITVLEKQANHLVKDIVSRQPLKGEFKAAFAQTLVQLAERAGQGFTPSWYNSLRTKVGAHTSAQQPLDGSAPLPPDDPFAPGTPGSEIDVLELNMPELDLSDADLPAHDYTSPSS